MKELDTILGYFNFFFLHPHREAQEIYYNFIKDYS